MKYILDTDTIIYFLKGHAPIVEKLTALPINAISTTIINHSELLYGAFNSQLKQQNLKRIKDFLQAITITPFCEAASFIFAEQKAILKNQGTIIADLDLMIASITLRHNTRLVTNNTKHFARIEKLKLENWYNNP